MVLVAILVAFSSVSGFVSGDLAPGMHTTIEGNGEHEARDTSQDGGEKERSIHAR